MSINGKHGLTSWIAVGALAGTLTIALPLASARAQETSTRQPDSTMQQDSASTSSARADSSRADSSQWGYAPDSSQTQAQNPPGYRGMERPTNAESSDSGMADSTASANASSRVNQMQRADSAMTQPGDTTGQKAQATKKAGTKRKHAAAQKKTSKQQASRDTTSQDSTKWGYPVNRDADQNPAGYRGMERPASSATADSAKRKHGRRARHDADTASAVRTGRDTTGGEMNSQTQDSTMGTATARDSVDIIHERREVAPGVGHATPPYPADSERVWVQQRPGNDSVSISADSAARRDSAPQDQR